MRQKFSWNIYVSTIKSKFLGVISVPSLEKLTCIRKFLVQTVMEPFLGHDFFTMQEMFLSKKWWLYKIDHIFMKIVQPFG